ncbi:P-loop containing nucleoside triphosphate hydrolases superfamily protein [Actinidia rufa]|uniref:P-loop containing nucleoside triphosphate hydrolases superfamily protein n=1 Tax=Actinidia rufa TaxID=165716 RepID=A0A7J0DYG8_9ERIC|nr:P-loop containing nucleoside triphosphate hydrolases superfamily protein [Actinidia rufa]
MTMNDMFGQLGSIIAGVMFIWAMFQQFFPHQLRSHIEKQSQRFVNLVYPYIQITFNEFTGERLMRSEAYSAIETYLSSNSSMQAKRLKADIVKNSQSLALSMDDHEEVADEFEGIKLWWASGKSISKAQSFSLYPITDEKRYYKLTFHKRHRELIIGPYLNYVLKEGKAIKVKNRQRKLYTNNGSHWSHVVFEHPATFQTLAMDPEKKKEIIDDLITFSKAENFYARIGRAWKRGYLLYGPPGTGKSTMIAAMANLLGYDLYDLELTAVKDNTELRKLLIETSSKSIIVIEDIDCSADLTGQRKKKKEKDEEEEKDPVQQLAKEETDTKTSKVTLSGLLNFIDGLWSACGGERLIVFTTNYADKLDPALIRRGRMDKHIELSYCSFEAFKVLAKNYLHLESHHLFAKIHGLLEEINITPADVAESLMPKTDPVDAETCLDSLMKALEIAEVEAKLKTDEEASKKESLGKQVKEKVEENTN